MSVGGDRSGRVEMVDARASFTEFAAREGKRLSRVLIAHYGLDVGPDVAADALAWAWEHWCEVERMENPTGYLYRVAQSSARRHHRWQRPAILPPEPGDPDHPSPEPGLDAALASLSSAQRVAVLLVYSFGWTYKETAAAMDIPVTTVRNHLHRGMRRLRQELGEQS
jgi:DNA-directed RNA polymerase specialized sigma24 family protein